MNEKHGELSRLFYCESATGEKLPGFKIALRVCRRVALVAFAGIVLSAAGRAQIAGTGSIQGAISDPTGAVIPKATITATNTATGVILTSNSGSDGLYTFPNIDIGSYTLTVTASGFKRYTQKGIVLEVGSSISVNVSLTIGVSTQSVEVQATGLALQTDDPSFKQTIDEQTLTELPLNGRQVTSLITLSGGAHTAPSTDLIGSKTFFSSVVISVAGGMGNQTDYRLDGGDWNDYMTNVNLPFPFPDAVSEFSVEATALGAQSGLHPGGVVNVVTRSGSNQWHGSAFEFIRNNFVDATNFFSSSKDTLHQNQFGGTVGGKVITSKLFFFGGYQHTKADQSQSLSQAHVPTAANLLGDFSVTDGPGCQSSGQGIQLLNPITGAVLPNNQISPSLFTTQSLALQKYLPATTDPCGLVFYSIPSQVSENQAVGRADFTINSKHSLYGRYLLDDYTSPAFYSPTNILITTQTGNYERAQGLTLGETYAINSSSVNSFRATGSRRRDDRGTAPQGISPTSIGVDVYAGVPIGLPVTVSNKWSAYGPALATFNVNTFSFTDDLNLARGRHLISLGGEYVRSEFNENNTFLPNGSFSFSGVYSKTGPAGNSPGGTGEDANLDFLTGALNSFEQAAPQQNALRAPIPSLYVQDLYHATNRLVLSAGVRWDPEYIPVDYFHRGAIFNYSDYVNNVHSVVYSNGPAGVLYYGDAGVPPAFTKNSLWQFSPRLGITFDPQGDGKTVFRAGAALVYDEPCFFTLQGLTHNPPTSTVLTNNPVSGAPLSFANPWPGGNQPTNPFPLPFKPPSTVTFPNSGGYSFFPGQFHPPYTVQWTLSIQRELSHGWQFQVDYIGNKTSFLGYGHTLDPAVYIPGTCGSSPCSTTGNAVSRFALTLANPAQGRFFSGGNGVILIASGANASYNGMVATIQHRMSSTFSFLANYTWSHCLDIEDEQGDIDTNVLEDASNIKLDRGNCGSDYRSIFNTTMVAQSKFHLSGWKSEVIDNWEIAPLITVTDGSPFSVLSGEDNSLTSVNNDRPNLINPGGVYTGKKITKTTAGNRTYINASAFTENALGTYGNLGRDTFRSLKFVQMDAELTRTFPIREKLKMDLRFEGFNVLNHPALGSPNASFTSSTFGQISSTASYGARVFQGSIKLIF